MTLEYLQNYWWLLIAVLGALLVFLLFVQGGQTMLFQLGKDSDVNLAVNALGRKWELTFTTLVVFGGAFFAAFPLFYSTSFGGAYWLWMLILFSFIVQAVSYEYRSKPGNILGRKTYDTFLLINGLVGCVLLGVAVSMFFFGAEFTVSRGNLLDSRSPVISQWAPTHGFEAIFSWRYLVLGVAVFFLARMQGCLYLINSTAGDAAFDAKMRQQTLFNGGIFVVFFLWFMGLVLTADGYKVVSVPDGTSSVEFAPYKYFHNFIDMWWALAALLAGVVLVLYGYVRTIFSGTFRKGIWFTGTGTILVVMALFCVAGYGDTAYLPSLADPSSSLTIRNSSSSLFTLTVMSWVSVIVPFVAAYIWIVWRKMDSRKLTPEEVAASGHKY